MRQWAHSSFVLLLSVILLGSFAVSLHVATADRALETHEMFVAQTAREMVASGDPVVPTFGGELRLKKPPLMYWAVAGLGLAFQQHDIPPWIARLPSVFATVGLVWITALLGRAMYGPATGLLAASVIGFSTGVFEYAGNARPEMLYAFTTSLGAYGLLRAWLIGTSGSIRGDAPHRDPTGAAVMVVDEPALRRWCAVGWLGIGLALLAKGPQIPLLMLAGMLIFSWRCVGLALTVRVARPLFGLGMIAIVCLPWVVAVCLRIDGAAEIWYRELIGYRFGERDGSASGLLEWLGAVLTPDYAVHLVKVLLPWGLFVPLAFLVPSRFGPSRFGPSSDRAELARGRMLLAGVLGVVVGLSLVRHSRDYYLLPILPLLAVPLARGLIGLFESAAHRDRLRVAVGATVSAIAIAGLGTVAFVVMQDHTRSAELAEVGVAMLFASVGVAIAFARLRPRRPYPALLLAIASWAMSLGAIGDQSVIWNERRERIDDVATFAAEQAGDAGVVFVTGFDPSNLIYRLNRRPLVILDGWTPETLAAQGSFVLVAPPSWAEELERVGARVRHGPEVRVGTQTTIEVMVVESPPDH